MKRTEYHLPKHFLRPYFRAIVPMTEEVRGIEIIDQSQLPYILRILPLTTFLEVEEAIIKQKVRGTPLVGLTAAFGVAFALTEKASDNALDEIIARLIAISPSWIAPIKILAHLKETLLRLPPQERAYAAWMAAQALLLQDVTVCQSIGAHGLKAFIPLHDKRPHLRIMTHGASGALSAAAYGTALAPVYAAKKAGWDIHLFVSETRPRNKGFLTAWELERQLIPHTLITDSAAGLLMMQGKVDALIVGADRITANGDVISNIGTYLKALAAKAHEIPFYVAASHWSLDMSTEKGNQISMEERPTQEMRFAYGLGKDYKFSKLRQLHKETAIFNPAFDITPISLVTGFITEEGLLPPRAVHLKEWKGTL